MGNALTCELTPSSWETRRLLGGVGVLVLAGGGSPFPPSCRKGRFDSADSFNKLPWLFSDEKL